MQRQIALNSHRQPSYLRTNEVLARSLFVYNAAPAEPHIRDVVTGKSKSRQIVDCKKLIDRHNWASKLIRKAEQIAIARDQVICLSHQS